MAVILLALVIPSFGSEESFDMEKLHKQKHTTMTADLFNYDFKIKNPGKNRKLFLHYKNINDKEFKSIEVNTDTTNEELELLIPKNVTAEPGFEYQFTFIHPNGKEVKSKTYKIRTKIDPIIKESSGGAVGDPYYFYDIDKNNGYLPDDTYVSAGICRSPIGTSSSSEEFPSVTSKFAEIRTVQPNPHNGVDLSVYQKQVRACYSGKVAWVNPSWDGSTRGAGRYVILGHGTLKADGSYPWYSRYLHLDSVDSSITEGATVSKGQLLGISGDSGAPGSWHLDFGFLAKWGSSEDLFMPPERFFSTSNWNNEKDLGFIQVPYWNSSTSSIDVVAYPKGTNDGSTLNVYIVLKPSTSSTWTTYSMSSVGNYTYRFIPSSQGISGTIDYYIKATRPGYSTTYYMTRPYYKPNQIPTSAYRITI